MFGLVPDRHRARLVRAGLLALALLAMARGIHAEPLWAIPNPRVVNGKWVSDETRALRPETVSRLNSAIADLERTTSAEMAVVVVRSLDGMSIEDAASRLFERWGIGKKGRDNGVLLLWSVNDRRVRIEVGYGLEEALPDGKAGAILDTFVIPRFKAGDFDQGVIAGVDAVLKVVRNEPVALPLPASGYYEHEGRARFGGWFWIPGSLVGGVGLLVGFRKWRRHRPRWCPQCRSRMHRLDEGEDDSLLEGGQVAEERVGSIDYDVWKCGACAHHYTLRYPRWRSDADDCPQCHNRTRVKTEHVVDPPTTRSSGTATVVEQCAFCTFKTEYSKVLPQIIETSSSSSSSGFGSSHGGGSSRSSGGSSFGGGRSGGGGASRGY